MNNYRHALLFGIFCLIVSCRPEKDDEARNGQSDPKAVESPKPSLDSTVHSNVRVQSSKEATSYQELREQFLKRAERNRVEAPGILRDFLETRRLLISSIPAGADLIKDREEAWEYLKPPVPAGYFWGNQLEYADNLLKKYADASQIDKLIIWEVIRIRMEYLLINGPMRGSETDLVALQVRMAKFLSPVLSVDNSELFDRLDPRSSRFDGARGKAEFQLYYLELQRDAERLIEKHWNLVR